MDANVLLVAHASAVVACVAMFVVVARRGGSARFLALCVVVALLHLGDVAELLALTTQSLVVLTHVALSLLPPLLVMVIRPEASRYESGIVWLAAALSSVVTIASGAQIRPGIILAAIVIAYLIVERLVQKPAGVAARGIVASLVMTEIFVVVLLTTGFRPEFPRLEWWLYASVRSPPCRCCSFWRRSTNGCRLRMR